MQELNCCPTQGAILLFLRRKYLSFCFFLEVMAHLPRKGIISCPILTTALHSEKRSWCSTAPDAAEVTSLQVSIKLNSRSSSWAYGLWLAEQLFHCCYVVAKYPWLGTSILQHVDIQIGQNRQDACFCFVFQGSGGLYMVRFSFIEQYIYCVFK